MKTKNHYQPSEIIDSLFTTAIIKIKADAEKTIVKLKAMSETEVASVKAETKEPLIEQKVEPEVETEAASRASAIKPETESSEQTDTNETKLEAGPVSGKETTETFGGDSEQEAKAAEQEIADADAAFEDVAEEKVLPEVETEASSRASAIEPETESSEREDTNETKLEAEPVSGKETTETFGSDFEQETEAPEQEIEEAEAFEDIAEEKVLPEVETEAAGRASAIKPETESSEQKDTSETKSEAEPVFGKETTETFWSDSEQEAKAAEQEIENADAAFEDLAEEKVEIMAESREPDEGEVSKSIRQIAQSQSNQPRKESSADLSLCAKDVMLKKIVWGSPEDSVQQAITKMQQYDSRYLMVGIDGVLVGIVSNSSVTGALSPYLRPVFAKWRRPLDDATLQIRIKWIMSRPVHIVKPQTPLANIIGNMCRYGVLCLPVVDQKGKVLGLVTEADIFKVLLGLKGSPGISASGNEQREQYTSGHRGIESTPTMEPDLVAPV